MENLLKLQRYCSKGMLVVVSLLLAGWALQILVGPVKWSLIAFPINVILLVVFLFAIVLVHLLSYRFLKIRWIPTLDAAIPAMSAVAFMMVIMGLVPQNKSLMQSDESLGMMRMLSYWPFVLLWVWIETILGFLVLKQIHGVITVRRIGRTFPSLLVHVGFFMAMLFGTLGNGDIQHLRLHAEQNKQVNFALDENSLIHELDFSLLLHDFSIELYPARLVIVSDSTDSLLRDNSAEVITWDKDNQRTKLCGWEIKVEEYYDHAEYIVQKDISMYVPSTVEGSCSAAKILAEKDGARCEGWVSCGSYLTPRASLPLTDGLMIVMPEREARHYISDVSIVTANNAERRDIIEVNRPVEVNGWKIYQFGYDEQMGEWSTISIFELVKDPWLPFVYVGIGLLMMGTLLLFFRKTKEKMSR